MTAPKILTVDMDVHAEPIAEHAARHPQQPIDKDRYAALGGMRPGMVAGPKTDLPMDEIPESTWHAVRHGLLGAGALLGFLLTVAAVAMLLSALIGGVLR